MIPGFFGLPLACVVFIFFPWICFVIKYGWLIEYTMCRWWRLNRIVTGVLQATATLRTHQFVDSSTNNVLLYNRVISCFPISDSNMFTSFGIGCILTEFCRYNTLFHSASLTNASSSFVLVAKMLWNSESWLAAQLVDRLRTPQGQGGYLRHLHGLLWP